MPEIPDLVLLCADSEPPIVTADDVASWSSGVLETLVADGVLVGYDNATHVACPECGGEHVEEVAVLCEPPGSAPRGYIPCPAVGRVKVSLERLLQWRINRDRLSELTDWKPRRVIDASIPDPIELSVTDVAKYVGVSDRTIREWRTSGRLPTLPGLGGGIIVSKMTLQILRDSRK